MKGSTLHRSGLTREKMGVLASLTNSEKKHGTRAQLNQYYRAAKTQELDLLWGGVQRGIQKVQGATRSAAVSQKSPAAYLMIGFIAGVLFMSCITLIVSISSMAPREAKAPKAPEAKVKQLPSETEKTNVAVIGEDNAVRSAAPASVTTHEKYVVKSGDTLNGIAYRFYGRYNEAKIQEIQRINRITNPAALSIGQELLIPVSQER